MLNKVTLIGNLGRDPEIRHFEGGSKVTKFSLATNESYKDKMGEWQTITEWHEIVCWGNQAERAERQLKKGNLIYVEGRISTRKWQDKEGNDRYTTEIIANYFRSLERRESSQSGMTTNFPSVEDHFPGAQPVVSQEQRQEKAAPMPEDDLPF